MAVHQHRSILIRCTNNYDLIRSSAEVCDQIGASINNSLCTLWGNFDWGRTWSAFAYPRTVRHAMMTSMLQEKASVGLCEAMKTAASMHCTKGEQRSARIGDDGGLLCSSGRGSKADKSHRHIWALRETTTSILSPNSSCQQEIWSRYWLPQMSPSIWNLRE